MMSTNQRNKASPNESGTQSIEWVLDRNSDTPIYVQIKNHILHLINTGHLAENDALPSEPKLAEELGVSKMTIRQAVGELVKEGRLKRERGKGTFVCTPKVSIHLPYFMSYTEDMRRRGFVPSTRIVAIDTVAPGKKHIESLSMNPNDMLIKIVRLRYADHLPMVVETAWVNASLVPGIADLHKQYPSRYDMFEKHYDILPTRAEQTLEAVSATLEEASYLGIAPGSPVILIESIMYDQSDRPVELTKSIYRGDRYKVYFQRSRSNR